MQKFTSDYINVSTTGDSVQMEQVVRVRRTELAVSTVWTLEKFKQKLSAMRELYRRAETAGTETADGVEDDGDVFFDPDDAFVADSTDSLHSPHL